MARTGASPEDLEALGRSFDQVGSALTSGGTTVRSLLETVWWQGADAQRFRSQFAGQQRQLARIAESLSTSAQTLRREAEEQRSASAAGGSGSGGSASGSSRPSNSSGSKPSPSILGFLDRFGFGPASTPAERNIQSALLKQMGLGSHNGKPYLDPKQASRWLEHGPATSAQAGALMNALSEGTLPASHLASTLLGTANFANPLDAIKAERLATGISKSFQLGIERNFQNSGELGFATYDSRLHAFLGAQGSAAAHFSAGLDGVSASGEVRGFAGAIADGSLGVGIAGFDAAVYGHAMAGAQGELSGQADISLDGVDLGGSVSTFAGAAVGYGGSVDGYGASLQAGGGGATGIGFDVGGDVSFGMDKVGVKVDLLAALGIGPKVNLGVSFSPNEAAGKLGSLGVGVASSALGVADVGGSVVKGVGKGIGKVFGW